MARTGKRTVEDANVVATTTSEEVNVARLQITILN